MLALAWTLGLTPLGPRDPEAYGLVQDALDDEDLVAPAPRDETEVRAMLVSIEALLGAGEPLPPNETFGEPCLAWRRHALRWALGDEDDGDARRRPSSGT